MCVESKATLRAHATLVLSRLDVTLRSAASAPWGCAPGTLCVASKCEQAAWQSYRCVNDLLLLAPRGTVHVLLKSIGSSVGASRNRDGQCGCFDPSAADLILLRSSWLIAAAALFFSAGFFALPSR